MKLIKREMHGRQLGLTHHTNALIQGHDFRCVPKSVAVIFQNCLNNDPQKRALVDELGFGVFSSLPNYYLKQKVLKQIYNCFNTYDNTIHTVAGEVEITTEKIGKSLGLNHTDSTYDEKITPKEMSGEDYDAYKFFQGKTQAALSSLIINTKVDTEENKVLFKRAFLLYIQKCFLLSTSAPNVTPREIEKAKKNNAKSVSGCCYALMVIYFHEIHFGKNSRDAAAQPPWIQYWTGKTLWKRMKHEKTMAAGLIKTAKMHVERQGKSKKKAKKTSSSSSESKYIGSDETFSLPGSDSEQTMSDSMVLVERRTRSTKDSVSEMQDGHTLAQAVSSIKKRKNLQREERRQKRTKQQDEQDQQPPQTHGEPEPTPITMLVPKAEPDMVPTTEKMIDKDAPSQSVLEVVSEDEHEPQPNPIKVIVPKIKEGLVTSPNARLITEVLMSMGQDKGEEPKPDSPPDPSIPSFSLNLDWSTPLVTEEQPPITLEEEFPLTARTMQVIEGMDEQVSGDRPPVETPKPTQVMKDDLEERVTIWVTVPKGDNEFETIFKLRGHRILEALRYQFTSMAPTSYIDIQVVTLMCHVLNADADEQFEKLVYCVPPEILQRMFATHNHNWMDKKKRRPHEISSLLNHTEFLAYFDREKLNSHRFLFAPVLYSEHWWLYVLDKSKQEMFVLDSKNISSPSSERTELNKFAMSFEFRFNLIPKSGSSCAVLVEFRKKIVAKIILSKENSLRVEAIKEAHNMRLTRPAATLRRPYVQVATLDLPTK
ncbi:hypothetical protein PIB30_072104 [Stylosanthes scabra]|uniref:Ubiquitin-like protease family profile domain-containing protein n=1 Tax=Stylosanthes scabra TaxID=79078 RepID=A0ABU6ZML2_9FABA|nr:hypothetical protein [Stylosanthes scabra]